MSTVTVENIRDDHASQIGSHQKRQYHLSHAAVGVLLQRIEALELQVEMAGYDTPVYHRGVTAGVIGILSLWRQALDGTTPKGTIQHSIEDLCRETEALRQVESRKP
jgi:hypothetical protein